MEFLKSLDLSLWWRAVFAAGFALVVAAMAAKDHDVVIIGFGMAAFGLGEWLNRPRVGSIELSWYESCLPG